MQSTSMLPYLPVKMEIKNKLKLHKSYTGIKAAKAIQSHDGIGNTSRIWFKGDIVDKKNKPNIFRNLVVLELYVLFGN